MIYNFNKKGKIDQDITLAFSFISIILILSVVTSRYCYSNYVIKPTQKSIIAQYNNIINQFRKDSYIASKVEIATGTLSFLDSASNIFSKYELNGKNLLRYDKSNKLSTIFENVESLSFTTNKDTPNLVTVRIYPINKNEIPFFTSFALRGYSNGK